MTAPDGTGPAPTAGVRPRRRRWVLRIALAVDGLLVLYMVVTFVQVLAASREDDDSATDAIVVMGAAQLWLLQAV